MLNAEQEWELIKNDEYFTVEWCQEMIKIREKDIARQLNDIERFKKIIMYKTGLNP